ncbi:MAG: hypothetical protein KF761_00665 [Salinibacterium sp.]|nr:hypothetical protein [Salinibacterium sp.]
MIVWFEYLLLGIAVLVGVFCLVLGFAGRKPSDYTLGATAVVELLLLAQLVMGVVVPLAGNPPTGSLPEFWVYLVSALLIPPAAVAWALVDRNRWSTAILGVACLAVAVMVYRMGQIWFVQVS